MHPQNVPWAPDNPSSLDTPHRRTRPGGRLGVSILQLSLICTACGFLIVTVPWFAAFLAPTAVGLIGLKLLLNYAWPRADEAEAYRRLVTWTYIAFFAHLILGAAITFVPGGTAYFGPDAQGYHRIASQVVQHWSGSGPLPVIPNGKEGFYILLASLYRALGPYQIAGIATNAVFGAAIIPLMAGAARQLLGPQPVRFIPPLLLLLPGFAVWPSQLLREAGVLFLIALAIHTTVFLTTEIRLRPLLLLSTSLALLFTFRGPVGLVLAGTLLVVLVLSQQTFLKGFGSGLAVSLLLTGLVLGAGLGYAAYQMAFSTDVRDISTFQVNTAIGAGSGFVSEAQPANSSKPERRLLISTARFFLGPFPWEISGRRHLAGLVDAIPYWLLLPSLFVGLRRAVKSIGRRVAVLILPAAALTLLLSMSFGNYGLLLRERIQVVMLLTPLIALGLARQGGSPGEARVSDARGHAFQGGASG